jgi:hypothetical protein
MCGTPDFLMDARRGLYSYPALQSRLTENAFAKASGVSDYSGPVLRLSNLSAEDLFVLLGKLRHVFANGDPNKYLLPDEALKAFMLHCSKRIGEAYFRTPRTTIKSFVDLLSILEQDPGLEWKNLLGQITIEADVNQENITTLGEDGKTTETGEIKEKNPSQDTDELGSFKL